MVKPQKAKSKIIKKKWYTILAPKAFNEVPLGEILLTEPDAAKGRSLTVSLMSVIGDPQKQNHQLKLALKDFNENRYTTEVTGYQLLPAAVKRMIRRNREKLDDSFVVKTKDERLVRLKPLLVTRGKTTNSVLTAMRKFIRAHLAVYASTTSFEDLIREVISKRVQIELSKLLKKFHPVGIFDIRMIAVVSAERAKKGMNLLVPKEAPKIPAKEVAEV